MSALVTSCDACGCRMSDKPFSNTDTRWGDSFLEAYLSGNAWRQETFWRRSNLIKLISDSFNLPTKTALDVGSAAGFFLGHLSFFEDRSGVEVDDIFLGYAQANTSEKISYYKSSSQIQKHSVDFVSFIDSINYFDPITIFNEIDRLLTPDGWGYICSLDLSSLTDRRILEIEENDCFRFLSSSTFLEDSLRKSGFQIIELWSEGKNFNTFAGTSGSIEYWKSFLGLDCEIRMVNIIFQRLR